MISRTIFRLRDIVDAVDQINVLLAGETHSVLVADRVKRAAFERFLEILSEASRHIPPELKVESPEIEWKRIADIGNHLRHAYHRVDAEILWRLHEDGHLAALRSAVSGFIAKLELNS